MYGLRLRNLATVFVDAQSLGYSASLLGPLSDAFRDEGLFPTLIQEGPMPRIALTSPNGDWRLLLLSQRFDVWQLPTSPVGDGGMAGFADFCARARPLLTKAIDHFGKKGHRLAALQEGFLPDMSAKQLDDVSQWRCLGST